MTTPEAQQDARYQEVDGTQFQIRSELMENYTTVRAIDLQNATLLSCADKEGNIQLYSRGSDDLYNIFPAPHLPGGWAQRPMYSPVDVAHFAVGRELGGAIITIVCGSDSHIYWKTDEPWSSWQDLGQPFGSLTVLKLRSGYDANGELLLHALTELEYPSTENQYSVMRIYPRNTQQPWDYVSQYIEGKIWDFMPGSGLQGAVMIDGEQRDFPVAGAYVSISDQVQNDTNVRLFGDHQILMRELYQNTTNDMDTLAGVQNPRGYTELFGRDIEGNAYYFEQYEERGSNLVNLSMDYSENPVSFMEIGTGFSRTASEEDRQLLDFFGVSDEGTLYHARQQLPLPDLDGSGDAPSQELDSLPWSTLMPLGDDFMVGSQTLTVCQDGQGYSHCFAVTDTGRLVELTETSESVWQLAVITLPDLDKPAVSYSCYSSEITVLDDLGVPVPSRLLSVSASDYKNLEINGSTTQVGPNKAVQVATNSAGRITISSASIGLSTANFRIGDSVLSDSALVVNPSRYVQDVLCPDPEDEVSGQAQLQETLQNATYVDENGNTQPLLGDVDDWNSVTASIWHGMSLGQVSDGDDALSAQFVSKRGDQAGVYVSRDSGFGNRIDPSKVKKQFWHIRFTDNGPVFTELQNHEQAQQLRDALQARALLHSPEFFSWHHSKPEWGSLWHGIKHAADVLQELVVTTLTEVDTLVNEVVTRIETTVSVLIDGIETAIDYVVDSVEQAFDMVESVLASIGADFKKVFSWLGTMFDTLFSWHEIIELHNALNDMSSSFMGQQLPSTMENIRESVDDAFTQIQSQIATIEASVAANGGDSTLGDAYDENVDNDDKAAGPSDNWVQNQILNSDGGEPMDSSNIVVEDASPFQAFEQAVINDLGSATQEIIVNFNQAFAQGRSIGDLTPNEIVELVGLMIADDLLTVVNTTIDIAFDFSEFVVASTAQLSTERWHIPVLSKLYSDLTGSELSVNDLVMLAIAMPLNTTLKASGVDGEILNTHATNMRIANEILSPAQLFGRDTIDDATHQRLLDAGYLQLDDERRQNLAFTLSLTYSIVTIFLGPMTFINKAWKSSRVLNSISAAASMTSLMVSFPYWPSQPIKSYTPATCAVWALQLILTLVCNCLPAINSLRPKVGTSDEQAVLLSSRAGSTAASVGENYVFDVINFFGGAVLAIAYSGQTIVETLSDDYMVGASNFERNTDLILKLLANALSTAQRMAAPLSWPVFAPGGEPALGLICVFSGFLSGGTGLVRAIEDKNNDNDINVI